MQLVGIDDEVLAQARKLAHLPGESQVIERAAEVRSVGEHRQGDGASACVGAHDLRQVGLLAQHAGRGGAALELGDDADAGPRQGLGEAPAAGSAAKPRQAVGIERPLALSPLELVADFGQDPLERIGHVVAHPMASAGSCPRLASR